MKIVSIIQYTGVSLSKRGNKYVGLCPLHSDKDTPSLTIYPQTESWYCFGCGKGGDVFEFIKLKFDFTFPQAKQWVKEHSSNLEEIELPDLSIKEKPNKHPPLIEHTKIQYFHSLMDSSNKRKYWHNRGFTDRTIDTQLLGYDGTGYTIPIWEAEPQKSKCLGYKVRNLDTNKPKYVRIGNKEILIYGRYYCEFAPTIMLFAGELDCLRAIQDGFPSCSVIDGMNCLKNFPKKWPNKLFPHNEKIIIIFDVGEETIGAKFAEQWEESKGKFTSDIFHWLDFDGKDYCDYRLKHDDFNELIERYL